MRILTLGMVYCRWGRPRVFKNGQPDDEPNVHGNQWDGGFLDFKDISLIPVQ